jgi:SAM-dependent methyltransferase
MTNTASRAQSRTCAVCESAEKRVIFRQPLTLPVSHCTYAGYDIVTCATCGFIFADTGIAQDDLDEHYAGQNKIAQSLSVEGEAERDFPRIDNALRLVMPLVQPSNRIFDVGCGTGRLLGLLKQNGYKQVSGIDSSPVAAAIAQVKHDVPVIVGSIFDYQG